jgi:hypothetical protein
VVIGMARGVDHWHSLPEFPPGVCCPTFLGLPSRDDQAVCMHSRSSWATPADAVSG